MGYHIQMIDSNFDIPETAEVLQALKDINTKWHSLKNGGCSVKWFAWMPDDYDQTATSVKEIFELLRFEVAEDNGTIKLVYFKSKMGQENLFLAAVAPFVKDGSYVAWRGQDDVAFRHIVRGGKLYVQKQVSSWTDETPFMIGGYEQPKISPYDVDDTHQ